MDKNVFVILDTNLNEELVNEGYARELISKVQQLRKSGGLEMMDNIRIYISADDEIRTAAAKYNDYICRETLALSIEERECGDEYDLNGHKTGIEIEKQ